MASPLVAVLCQRFPKSRRLANLVGLAILTSALVAASFTNTTGALLATQGVLFGIGGVTLYFPAMYLIDEWFIARKGLAFAVIWTGSGIGGAVFPFVSQWLLDSYGFRTALRVWAVIIVSVSLLCKDRQHRLTLSTGRLCSTVHHGDQKPSSSVERQHAAAYGSGFLEDGIILDILVREHDAVNCLLSAPALDTIIRPRVWNASRCRSTRPMLTQLGSMWRLHFPGHDGRSLPRVRSRVRRFFGIHTCCFRLLGPHHFASDALCLRHPMGSDWWWVCWQLGRFCKIHHDSRASHRYRNGHFAALCEQGSRIDYLWANQREIARGTAYRGCRFRLRHSVRRHNSVHRCECFVGRSRLRW
jgi:hypothetical protein